MLDSPPMGALLAKPTLILALVVVGLIAMAVIARNHWGCTPPPKPPIVSKHGPYTVVSVDSGALIQVRAGLAGKRTKPIVLAEIAAPATGENANRSRENLATLAGASVWVETERQRILFRATSGDPAEEAASMAAEMEARGPLIGVVYGESGVCLNAAQVAQGWAVCEPDAPEEWQKLQAEAAKAKRGIWKAR